MVKVIALLAVTEFSSCKKCKGENPSARIVNNGTSKASVQIKTSGGNTVNLNNVDPGTSSAYASYAPRNGGENSGFGNLDSGAAGTAAPSTPGTTTNPSRPAALTAAPDPRPPDGEKRSMPA